MAGRRREAAAAAGADQAEGDHPAAGDTRSIRRRPAEGCRSSTPSEQRCWTRGRPRTAGRSRPAAIRSDCRACASPIKPPSGGRRSATRTRNPARSHRRSSSPGGGSGRCPTRRDRGGDHHACRRPRRQAAHRAASQGSRSRRTWEGCIALVNDGPVRRSAPQGRPRRVTAPRNTITLQADDHTCADETAVDDALDARAGRPEERCASISHRRDRRGFQTFEHASCSTARYRVHRRRSRSPSTSISVMTLMS